MNTAEATLRPWMYSVKLETNAKGWIQPCIHVYADESDVWKKATCLLDQTIDELKTMGLRVATDIKEKEKE